MEKVISAIFDFGAKQGIAFLMMVVALAFFYDAYKEKAVADFAYKLDIQLQLDTVNRRLDMCRDKFDLVLLNQIAENTNVFQDVKRMLGESRYRREKED